MVIALNRNKIRAHSLKMACVIGFKIPPSHLVSSCTDVHLFVLFPSTGTNLWTNQLQIGERNWGREKLELLERFSHERAQWDQRLREATAQQGKV